MFFDTSYSLWGDSTSGTAAANSSTNIDYPIVDSYLLYGFQMMFQNANAGDYVQFQVVDVNNILGYGANFVLAQQVNKWYVPSLDLSWTLHSDTARTIPAGLYLRVIYTNTSLLVDAKVWINYAFINPTAPVL